MSEENKNCKDCGGCQTGRHMEIEPNDNKMFPFKVRNGCDTHEFRSKAMAINYINLQKDRT